MLSATDVRLLLMSAVAFCVNRLMHLASNGACVALSSVIPLPVLQPVVLIWAVQFISKTVDSILSVLLKIHAELCQLTHPVCRHLWRRHLPHQHGLLQLARS